MLYMIIAKLTVLFAFSSNMGGSESREQQSGEKELSFAVVLKQIEDGALKWLEVVENMRKDPYNKGEYFRHLCKESGKELNLLCVSPMFIVCTVTELTVLITRY